MTASKCGITGDQLEPEVLRTCGATLLSRSSHGHRRPLCRRHEGRREGRTTDLLADCPVVDRPVRRGVRERSIPTLSEKCPIPCGPVRGNRSAGFTLSLGLSPEAWRTPGLTGSVHLTRRPPRHLHGSPTRRSERRDALVHHQRRCRLAPIPARSGRPPSGRHNASDLRRPRWLDRRGALDLTGATWQCCRTHFMRNLRTRAEARAGDGSHSAAHHLRPARCRLGVGPHPCVVEQLTKRIPAGPSCWPKPPSRSGLSR
jgi:hypothetical protein